MDKTDLYNDLKGMLKIDKDDLDVELVDQPNSFFFAGQEFARATARRDKLKHDLEVLEAQLYKEIREEAAAEGEKITEKQLENKIKQEQSYHRAYKAFLDARLEADEWDALKAAYSQRAYVLKDLVALHVSGYFGEQIGSSDRRTAKDRVAGRSRG